MPGSIIPKLLSTISFVVCSALIYSINRETISLLVRLYIFIVQPDPKLKTNLFLTFGALVTAATAWSIWGQDMFPASPDPTGEPENWTDDEMRRWLNSRNLMAGSTATREELVARIKATMRAPRT